MKKPHLFAGAALLLFAALAHVQKPPQRRLDGPKIEPVAVPGPVPPVIPRAPDREIAACVKEFLRTGDEKVLPALAPREVVELLIENVAPGLVSLLLDRLDRGLATDPGTWRLEIVRGCESCAGDVLRLERFAEAMAGRVRDDGIAMLLLKRERPELAARFGAAAEVREALWPRVPDPAAVEALGWVIEPDEAVRLAAVGTPEARRALERAYERTRSPVISALLD